MFYLFLRGLKVVSSIIGKGGNEVRRLCGRLWFWWIICIVLDILLKIKNKLV